MIRIAVVVGRPWFKNHHVYLAPRDGRVEGLRRLLHKGSIAVRLCRLVADGALKVKIDACKRVTQVRLVLVNESGEAHN